MKTLNAFFKLLIKQPCEGSSFWQYSRQQLSHLSRQSRNLSLFLRKRLVSAFPVFAGSLSAFQKATSNNRTYLALILLLVVAPLSEVAYMLFDKSAPIITWYPGQHWITYEGVRVEGWYYMNFWALFYQLGPHIQDVVILTAAFFLMPETDKDGKPDDRRWLLVFAAGYPFAKILWAIQIGSDAEIHQIIPGSFLLVGLLIGFFWLFSFNYLVSLYYHKRTRPVATMEGAAKCDYISEAQLRAIIIAETQTLKALN